MAGTEGLGALFGKARKWAKQSIEEVTNLGASPTETRRLEEEHDDLGREILADAKQQRDEMIIDAVTPQSVKDLRAYNAANAAARATESAATARADRLARAGASHVTVSGYVNGTAEGLAVSSEIFEDGSLLVSVEPVDPAPFGALTMTGFGFVIANYKGDGSYDFADSIENAGDAFFMYVVEADEGWGYDPSFGPGHIVVSGGVGELLLTYGSSGNDTFELRGSIVLGDAVSPA